MRSGKIFLIFFGLLVTATGLAYLIAPLALAAPMEFGVLTPPALADFRANYGGLQLAIGIFLLYCVNTMRIKLGLLLTLIMMICVPLCRVISFAIDGGATQTLLAALALEIVLVTTTLIFYLREPADARW